MTFFRYFPAKEDVALSDGYDPLIAALLEQTPASWPLTQRIRTALLQGLRQVYDTDRDALLAQNKLIVVHARATGTALGRPDGHPAAHPPGARGADPRPASRPGSSSRHAWPPPATAILTWVENNGTPELPT